MNETFCSIFPSDLVEWILFSDNDALSHSHMHTVTHSLVRVLCGYALRTQFVVFFLFFLISLFQRLLTERTTECNWNWLMCLVKMIKLLIWFQSDDELVYIQNRNHTEKTNAQQHINNKETIKKTRNKDAKYYYIYTDIVGKCIISIAIFRHSTIFT